MDDDKKTILSPKIFIFLWILSVIGIIIYTIILYNNSSSDMFGLHNLIWLFPIISIQVSLAVICGLYFTISLIINHRKNKLIILPIIILIAFIAWYLWYIIS